MALYDKAAGGYVNAEAVVSTDWVAEHLTDPAVRIVESNEDPLLYSSGHVPGAVEVDWTRDLNDPLMRDYLNRDGFSALMSRIGVARDTHVVFYGDRNNWWACYALWVFSLFGHPRMSVMDGGRIKWSQEGRPMTQERPVTLATDYEAPERDDRTERAFREDVLMLLADRGRLIDVRSPGEFKGDLVHMPDFPNEGALRGGHIPTAANVPWARAVDPESGCFLPAERLREIYEQGAGLQSGDDVVTYCRIGERSSHTWFVLRHLLGYPRVRNYDGSWTEWGNSVGVPIER